MKLISVIDIGSHSTKLEIFKVKHKNKLKRVLKENSYLYFYQDINSSSSISDDSVNELIKILNNYKSIIASYSCEVIKVIATSAFRDANNSNEIIKYIKEKLDLEIEIISGEEEAKYSQLAFLSLNLDSPNSVIFDLGGGSTEVTYFKNNEVIKSHSFDIGVIRCINDRSDTNWNNLISFLPKEKEDYLCLGLGSSVRRFAKMIHQKKKKKIFTIKKEDVESFEKKLVNKGTDYVEKKYNLNGLEPTYLKTIVRLLLTCFNTLNIENIYYYPISIRLGVAYTLLKELNIK